MHCQREEAGISCMENVVRRTNIDGSRVALFSPCDAYRYELLIRWNSGKPVMAFIGLNPSTADEMQNDPTISRLCVRAEALHCGALLMLNAFPFRATNPKDMLKAMDPYGQQRNPRWLIDSVHANDAQDLVIAGWGNDGNHLGRAVDICDAFRMAGITLHCISFNPKTGEPSHPLYLPYALKPLPYLRGSLNALPV